MSINKSIYNLCAGMLQEGESVEDCARRELYEETGLTAAFPATWAINGLTVGAGEAIACYGLGMLLLWQLPKIPYFRDHGCR